MKKQPAESPEIRNTQEFILDSFKQYYSSEKVPPPAGLENREFGAILMGRSMWRHLGFAGPEAMQGFLTKNIPLHVYHSAAYYEDPNAPTMEKKRWLDSA